jgi:hypothetical protein
MEPVIVVDYNRARPLPKPQNGKHLLDKRTIHDENAFPGNQEQ